MGAKKKAPAKKKPATTKGSAKSAAAKAKGTNEPSVEYNRLQKRREFRRKTNGLPYEVDVYGREQFQLIRKFIDDKSIRLHGDGQFAVSELASTANVSEVTVRRDIRLGRLGSTGSTCVRHRRAARRIDSTAAEEYRQGIQKKSDDGFAWWEVPKHVPGATKSWVRFLVHAGKIRSELSIVVREDGKPCPANCVNKSEFPRIMELLGETPPDDVTSISKAVVRLKRYKVGGATGSHKIWLRSGKWPTLPNRFVVSDGRAEYPIKRRGRTAYKRKAIIKHVPTEVLDQLIAVERMWRLVDWLAEVTGYSAVTVREWARRERPCTPINRFLRVDEVRKMSTLAEDPFGWRICSAACREIISAIAKKSSGENKRRLGIIAATLRKDIDRWAATADRALKRDSQDPNPAAPPPAGAGNGQQAANGSTVMPGVAKVDPLNDQEFTVETCEILKVIQAGQVIIDHTETATVQTRDGDDAYVLASKLWTQRPEFETYKQFKAFIDNTPELRRRKPSVNRLELHSRDWTNYWALHDRRLGEGLDAEPIAAEIQHIENRKSAASHRKQQAKKG